MNSFSRLITYVFALMLLVACNSSTTAAQSEQAEATTATAGECFPVGTNENKVIKRDKEGVVTQSINRINAKSPAVRAIIIAGKNQKYTIKQLSGCKTEETNLMIMGSGHQVNIETDIHSFSMGFSSDMAVLDVDFKFGNKVSIYECAIEESASNITAKIGSNVSFFVNSKGEPARAGCLITGKNIKGFPSAN